MVDVFQDGLGHLDFTRAANGSGMSSKNASNKFLGALHRAANMKQRNIFFENELKQVTKSLLLTTISLVQEFFLKKL